VLNLSVGEFVLVSFSVCQFVSLSVFQFVSLSVIQFLSRLSNVVHWWIVDGWLLTAENSPLMIIRPRNRQILANRVWYFD